MANTLRTPQQHIEVQDRYEFMLEAVHKLGQLAWEMIDANLVEAKTKPDTTTVTTVDEALNSRFIGMVEHNYPDDLVWGEEESNSEKNNRDLADKNWMWLIDPIDGTSGFWRSYKSDRFQECTSTIMVTGFAPGETTPTMSAIRNPFHRQKMTISADQYRAYYQSDDMDEPVRLKVPGHAPRNRRSVQRFEQSNWKECEPDLSEFQKTMPAARLVDHQIFMGSVALGDVDVSVFPGPSNPHDVAPGALIVHRAGGTVKTFKGERYEDVDWRVFPIAGTVGAVHEELADEVVSVYGLNN